MHYLKPFFAAVLFPITLGLTMMTATSVLARDVPRVAPHHQDLESYRNWRLQQKHNSYVHGDPNARNPERPGYMQQLGNTSGGPRY